MNPNTRQSRELNEANRQRFVAVFFAIIAVFMVAAWLMVYNTHTLFAFRAARLTFLPVVAVVMVAAWYVMIAYENYGNVERCENRPQPPPEPVARDIITYPAEYQEPRIATRDQQNPKRIIIAGQLVPIRNWRRLAHTLEYRNWRFTRQVVAESRSFTSLTKNWPQIHAEFIRLGWAVGNDVTEAGKAALQAEHPPTLVSELPSVRAH